MARLVRLDTLQQFATVDLQFDPGAIGGPKVIPNAAEITLFWVLGSGKTGHNVLTGRYSGTYSGSAAQANAIMTALTTGSAWSTLAGFIAPTASLGGLSLRDLNQPNQPLIANTTGGGAGTSTGTELPNEVSAVITTRTAFTGPANRGRVYVPGWATNALGTGNQMAAPAKTALATWASTIAGALSGSGYTWCIGHQARAAYTGSGGTQHPARVAGTVPITTVEVRDGHWDSQRRRGLR
jgi:hypothetical protein